MQLEQVATKTAAAFVMLAVMEAPVSGSAGSTEIIHYATGTPALLALLMQPNSEMSTATTAAACKDFDEGSAIAE